MRPQILAALVLLAACRGDDGHGDTGSSPTGPPPTDTSASFVPDAFGVKEARFALQDDGRIGPTNSGTWSLTVELVSQTGDRCDATFVGTDAVDQPTFPGTQNVFARAFRPAALPEGSCSAADLPEDWGDPMATLDAWAFGVGVTGSPEPDVLDGLDPADRAALEPYLFGGGVYLDGVDGDGDGSPDQQPWRAVAIAWSEDDAGALVPYEDRVSNGELLPGTYVVQPRQYFTPARALLRPPQ